MGNLGKTAFEAYRASVGGVAYDKTAIPEWEALRQSVRDGWEAAGAAVLGETGGFLRDRSEIDARLRHLLKILAESDPADDSTTRVHARALDLAWVLFPHMEFEQCLPWIDLAIEERRKGE